MAISKIVYKENSSATPVVWMDATPATAAAADIASPKTAMLADGVVTTGTGTGGGGGNVTAPEKWVNFIDYNGDILYSYTKSEIANLTALPANPSHSGLVSQGWNWTLAEIQAEVLAGTTKIWVGQTYDTVSGATEIDVEFTDPDYLSPYLYTALSGPTELTIDWGDGSTPYYNSSVAGTQQIQHTFPSVGEYTIKISIADNEKWYYFYNTQGNNHCSILTDVPSMDDLARNMIYANTIKAIRIGDHFYLARGAFRTLQSVEYITIPNTIRNVKNPSEYKIGYYPFAQCYSLKSITLPSEVIVPTSSTSLFDECSNIKNISIPASVALGAVSFYSSCRRLVHPHIPSGTTEIPNNCFYRDMSIIDIALPSGLATIGNNAFNTCQSIKEITIPASVTSIGNDAFRYNYGLLAYHFLSTTPPTLGNSTVFGGIHADCKIYVPSASVNAYKTATNWSAYSSYIQEEPQS